MKKILNYVKNAGLSIIVAATAMSMALSSCNNAIYDEEGDCSVNYRLKFRYDLNLKWADAFANEVKSVRVYAFDEKGTLVKEFSERGSQLANPDYYMTLDLPAGNYHLVAWCGIDNPGATTRNFNVPATHAGTTVLEELTCRLERKANETYTAFSDNRLEFMFHGNLDVELPTDDDGGDYTYTMSLTKDTNHLRVILQHLSGKDVDVSQYDFRIEDANGFYAHDNSLLADDVITYKAYDTSTGEAAIVKDDAGSSRATVYAKTAIADLSLGRMMANRSDKMMLTISNSEGKDIARVPVIEYALLAKDYYELAYGHRMSDQEFLDREDEYSMTFFIDENQEWYAAEILINSWRIVLHNYDVQ